MVTHWGCGRLGRYDNPPRRVRQSLPGSYTPGRRHRRLPLKRIREKTFEKEEQSARVCVQESVSQRVVSWRNQNYLGNIHRYVLLFLLQAYVRYVIRMSIFG